MNIYRVTFDELEDWGLLAVSLVDFPAVERNYLKFKDDRPPLRLKADTEQQVVTGIALLADTPIYRRDEERGEYYIVFEKDIIRKLVEKYSRDGLINLINLQHDENTYSDEQAVMVESYFVDKERGIAPMEFADVPNGSWVVSYKIQDPELWEKIKASHGEEGGLNGFSVEVVSGIEKMRQQLRQADKDIDSEDELAEALGIEKKKIELRVSRATVKDILREDVQVDIEFADGETVLRGQIKDLGKRGGVDVLSFYQVDKDRWLIVELDNISAIKATTLPLVEWNYDAPSYQDIVTDDEVIITDSREASDENLRLAIEGRYFVDLRYDDESGEPCTSSRVVQICAAGWHTGTGNKCFRAYEYFGATHTEVPAWKMFLVKRVRFFRIMKEDERWTSVPPLYHMNDSQMESILYQVNDLVIPEA